MEVQTEVDTDHNMALVSLIPCPPIHFSRAGGGVFNPGPQLLFEVGNN